MQVCGLETLLDFLPLLISFTAFMMDGQTVFKSLDFLKDAHISASCGSSSTSVVLLTQHIIYEIEYITKGADSEFRVTCSRKIHVMEIFPFVYI